ncbi:hypothetical protein JR316_0007925 [Psilocybe cubensis]|uniref:Uncharacterized protein n=2 Tax=Psilocybe cubensis TaxID=181762 RepID=A0A8H7XVN7_PSICU|nr:hypothetical protein JR316_0007925 [Psilocybe cubensis]KAH9479335.1 hypothetical protein JR316_0007925 [Psilocybe cubensis]
MKFTASAVFFSLASLVASASISKRNCVPAAKFGALSAFPSMISPGETLNIAVNFNCGAQFGVSPQFLEYTLEVPENVNNGEQPILLAQRPFSIAPGTIQPSDNFALPLPHAFYTPGATYNLVLNVVYPTNGTDGSTVLLKGSTSVPMSISS